MNGLMTKYDLFIFDWDGTLNNLGIFPKINETMKRLVLGGKKYKNGGKANKDFDLKERMLEEEIEGNRLLLNLVDLVIQIKNPRLQDSSKAVLGDLKKHRKKIALFTNARSYRLIKELKHLGVDKYFDTIVSSRDIKAMKPNPLGLNLIIKKLHVPKNRVIYIGDMMDDIYAAKYAKIASCAMESGFDDKTALREAKPRYMFESMEEFRKSL